MGLLMKMEVYAWFLIPAIILVGLITSYSDIKYGKIKNKWLMFFFLYGVFVYVGYFVTAFYTDVSLILPVKLGEERIQYSLLIQVISNFFLSLALGFTVWVFNIWSAADAKLFVVFSFLSPLHFYTNDLVLYIPGVVIAINSVILIIFFLFIKVLTKNFGNFKDSLKDTLTNPKELLVDVVMLFLIQGISALVFSYINKGELTIFFSLGVYSLLRYFIYHLNAILNKLKYVIILAVLARFLFEYEYIFSLDFLLNFSITVMIFVIIKNLFLKIADKTFFKRVHINKLEPGMIWDKYLVDTGEKIKPWEYYKKNMGGKIFLEPSVEGLTKEDVRRIKDAYKKNKLTIDSIDVPSRTYFAPFLFVATIITMILGGSLLTYIFPFLN